MTYRLNELRNIAARGLCRGLLAAGILAGAGGVAGAADGPATFFDGVWATAKDCVIHELLPEDRWNLYTAPDYYDSKGWHGWESACEFTEVTEVVKDETWSTKSMCTAENGEPEEGAAIEFTLVDDGVMRIDVPDEPDASGELIHNCSRLLAE